MTDGGNARFAVRDRVRAAGRSAAPCICYHGSKACFVARKGAPLKTMLAATMVARGGRMHDDEQNDDRTPG